jgi:SAM-dependent methyltransferase
MSESYWDQIASKAIGLKPKTGAMARNWLAIYTDTQIERLLVDNSTRLWKGEDGYLLDVGCGPGKWLKVFARNFSKSTIIGVDLSKQMLMLAKKQSFSNDANLVNMNAVKLALLDNGFDLVTSVTVLQHISHNEDWRSAIKEIVRVTKPTGFIIICDATVSLGSLKVRRFSEYVASFRAEGAKLIHWEGVDPSYPLKACGLLEYGRSFDSNKVYYFKSFPKFFSLISMVLCIASRTLDAKVGRSILGIIAPHKIFVFRKEGESLGGTSHI